MQTEPPVWTSTSTRLSAFAVADSLDSPVGKVRDTCQIASLPKSQFGHIFRSIGLQDSEYRIWWQGVLNLPVDLCEIYTALIFTTVISSCFFIAFIFYSRLQ